MAFTPDLAKAAAAVEAIVRLRSVSAAARELNISRSSVKTRLDTAVANSVHGAREAAEAIHRPIKKLKVSVRGGAVRRFLLTAAQDDTPVHEGFWTNLNAYADHLGAEIMVGGFTYQKGLFEDHSVAAGRFDARVAPMLRPEVVDLGPRIVWYGAANILPTAVDPLSGWETQTKDKWAVFPHAKIALRSVPVMPGAPGKQIMTTGVVTTENYVQRNAGQKASFHHTIGATVVEVTPSGHHFCRQISANKDGSFQDLDVIVKGGRVTTGQTVEAITWGDIHREFLDPHVALGAWGFNVETGRCLGQSLIDALRPRHQFIHDSFNFTARSHHTRADPHERARRLAERRDIVEDEIRLTSAFLSAIRRPWCTTVHVDSNHNQHLHRWVKDPTGHSDPVNARYWHELNAAALKAIEEGDEGFIIHEHALRSAAPDQLQDLVFLRAGQSYQICQATAPVECGLHADIGPNGARGSPAAFARVVERINGAHGHHPVIRESYYQAGTCSLLDLGYNTRGPGVWFHSSIVVYASGKRSIITFNGSEWRA